MVLNVFGPDIPGLNSKSVIPHLKSFHFQFPVKRGKRTAMNKQLNSIDFFVFVFNKIILIHKLLSSQSDCFPHYIYVVTLFVIIKYPTVGRMGVVFRFFPKRLIEPQEHHIVTIYKTVTFLFRMPYRIPEEPILIVLLR